VTLNKPDIGEQALSKAVEIGLSTQLDEVENLDVDIRTDPGKLIQGELESVAIEGKGLVMQKDLRAEELEVQMGSIAINPLSAAFGKIEPLTINTRQVQLSLPGDGKIALTAEIVLKKTGETKQISFTTVPRMSAGGERIALEDVQYAQGKELSPELTAALLERANELLDLRNFQLEGMSLRLKGVEVYKGKLTLQATARVEQFPDS